MTFAEVVLTYAGDRWRARGAGIVVEHRELSELDAELGRALVAAGFARAHVRFDFDALPDWLRQYHAHYFNYVVSVRAIVGASFRSRLLPRIVRGIASGSSLLRRQGTERA